MPTYFFYILIAIACFGCDKKPTGKAIPQPVVAANKYTAPQIQEIMAALDYKGDTAKLRTLFIEQNKLEKSTAEKIKWNVALADTLSKLKLDSLAYGIYDTAYQQWKFSKDHTLNEMARRCCYMKGMFWVNINYKNLLTEFETYFTIEPERLEFKTMEDVFAAVYLEEVYLRLGDKTKCLLYLNKAFAFNETFDDTSRWFAPYLSKANFLNQNDQFDSAVFYAGKGLSLPDISAINSVLLKATIAESWLGLKKYKEAIKTSEEALEILQVLQSTYPDVRGVYANALYADGNYNDAREQYHVTVVERLADNGGSDASREFSKLYKSFGDCFYKAGQPDSALYYYHKALASVVKIKVGNTSLPAETDLLPENAIQEALDAIADWWLKSNKTGRLNQALQALELAMKVDEMLQLQFSFNASKVDYQRFKKNRGTKAIGICYQLFKKDKQQHWISSAWAFSEAAKAAVLSDNIKQQIAWHQSATDSLVRKINLLQIDQSAIKTKMIVANNKDDLWALQAAYDSTDNLFVAYTTKLKQTNPAAARLLDTTVRNFFLHDPLFKNIPAVEFFAADSGRYYIFSKTETGTLALDSCTLQDTVLTNWLSFFKHAGSCNNQPIQFQQDSYSIYRKLLQGILQSKNNSSLIIVPDGLLWNLPWDALVTNTGYSRSWQKVPFLIKNTSVTLAFSLDNLAQQSRRPQAPGSECMAAFAPGFIKKERQQQPLEFSLQEIHGIEKTKPCGKYFTNKNATKAAFKNMVDKADILHISTHALSGQSEDSCQMQFYDSTLYLHELYPKAVSAKLVVLSACETSLGKFEEGEGVFSMSRGFYMAGAKNVITTLWQVNDESTAAIFKNFYQQKGEPYNMLHNAKLQYLEANRGGNASPYYWAAFVNTGYLPAINTPHNYWWVSVTAITLFFMVALAVWLKRKTKQVA